MFARGRKFITFVLVAGSLAGACPLVLAFAGFPSAALAAAGRVTIVSDGVPRTAISSSTGASSKRAGRR